MCKNEHCGAATIGRFCEGNGGIIKVQIADDGFFLPHVRILRANGELLACVRLDKAEYLPCKRRRQALTDEQIDRLVEFFDSPSDFPLVRLS